MIQLDKLLIIAFLLHTKTDLTLRCLGTSPTFSAMRLKGDNFRDFLFAYLEDEVFQKWLFS